MNDSITPQPAPRGTPFRRAAVVLGATGIGVFGWMANGWSTSQSTACSASTLTGEQTSGTTDEPGQYVDLLNDLATPIAAGDTVTTAVCDEVYSSTGGKSWYLAIWDADSDDYGGSHVCCFEVANAQTPLDVGATPSDATHTNNTTLGGSYRWAQGQASLTTNALTTNGYDCNEAAAAISPGATEVCDLSDVDEDCDGTSDDSDTSVDASTQTAYYSDGDGDGFGDQSAASELYCDPPASVVLNNSDCNDSVASINPLGQEVCDAFDTDEDCDGVADNADTSALASTRTRYFPDVDDDGEGDSTQSGVLYCDDPSNTSVCGDSNSSNNTSTDCVVANNADCDDSDLAINTSSAEITGDSVDQNCDGSENCFLDADNDGQLPASPSIAASNDTDCNDAYEGTTSDPLTDCDDNDSRRYLGAQEVCDAFDIDEDCDGQADDNDASVDATTQTTFYADSDSDGYGDASSTSNRCDAASGWVGNSLDCNDADIAISPTATETCDGVDNDCDGGVDELFNTSWYVDTDEDGYGDSSAVAQSSCTDPSDTNGCTDSDGAADCYRADNTDCDDSQPLSYPGNTEVCDSIDNDCDSQTDEGVLVTFYLDADGDGYGLSSSTQPACSTPSGYADAGGDCDDTNDATGIATFPGSAEHQSSTVCHKDLDNDGYGDDNPSRTGVTAGSDCDDTHEKTFPGVAQYDSSSDCMRDDDNDGFGDDSPSTSGVTAGDDCNDADIAISPNATETCDGVDNDCDGTIDNGALTQWYVDADNDGYGAGTGSPSCSDPTAAGACSDGDPATVCYRQTNTDCDDTDADTRPGIASSDSVSACMTDADGDGYGDANPSNSAVTAGSDCYDEDDAASAYAAQSLDADEVNPDATEACDTVDNDCDALVDEGSGTTYYEDADNDGYGSASSTSLFCDTASATAAGFVAAPTGDANGDGSSDYDCDDADPTANPGAAEVCDAGNVDEDCDGAADDSDAIGASPTGESSWYVDQDGDTYGSASATALVQCDQPTGYVTDNSDCYDSLADAASYTDGSGNPLDPEDVFPGQTETCNSVDDNCSGVADEGIAGTTWYLDADGDGYGANGSSISSCTDPSTTTDTYVILGGDCHDSNATSGTYGGNAPADINPGVDEICNSGIDDDCDGAADDADGSVLDSGKSTYYRDFDGDGYPEASTTVYLRQCNQPAGYVPEPSASTDQNNDGYIDFDCDDSNAAISPAAAEECDTGAKSYSYSYYTDVNDTSTLVTRTWATTTGSDENCNGIADDNDPDTIDQGSYTTWYADADDDGYGTEQTGLGTVEYLCEDPSYTDCDDEGNAAGDLVTASDVTAGITALDEGAVVCWTEDNSDCDDGNVSINPDADEVCDDDDVDENCNGVADDNDDTLSGEDPLYRDADGDGFGDAGNAILTCTDNPPGYVNDSDDCDDDNLNTYPSATEVCDGTRNDCNRIASGIPNDERDLDNDGYVECGFDGSVTWQGTTTINVGTDCEPSDPTTYPTAPEVCDGVYNDCNGRGGATSAPANETDNDGDGYVECYNGGTWDVPSTQPSTGEDCDDTETDGNGDGIADGFTIHPNASEICDGQYNDCDDPLYGTQAAPDDELDLDGDMWVECTGFATAIWVGDSAVVGGDDCNGSDPLVYPTAPELCDGQWNDCANYDATTLPSAEADEDNDNWVACTINDTWLGEASIQGGNDCDDTDDYVYPGATEVCDGQYNDCDAAAYDINGQPDDENDDDGDNFVECVRYEGTFDWRPSTTNTMQTTDPASYCPLGNADCYDCDDSDATTHPPYATGAGTPNTFLEDDPYACIKDADGDRYGDDAPLDGVTAGTDCNDTDDAVFPYAPEVCESEGVQVDNDCDGDPNTYQGEPVDETANGAISAYLDGDGDGFGQGDAYVVCELIAGYSSSGSDCDDLNPSIYPGAPEVCNEIDEDCDDEIDEAEDLDPATSGCVDMYRDIDEDGYGDYAESLCLCLSGEEADGATYRGDPYVVTGGDCDDFDDNTKPLSCSDGIDNDADGTTDENDPDCIRGLTEDGAAVETKIEFVDGNDNDCDGEVPAIELDCDDDGSLPLLPIQASSLQHVSEVGLSECAGQGSTLYIECWGDDEVQVICDLTEDGDGSGLWMLRLDGSDDNWEGRYEGGRRVYTERACSGVGDCDDQCAARCPDQLESCDGLDNDCSAASLPAEGSEGDGIPASMVTSEPVSGTISIDELDLDQDGFLACDAFSEFEIQVHTASAECSALVEAESFGGDCNNLCSLARPDAVERCNGFLDVCGGDAEGSDLDFDDMRTCGAFSAPLSDEMPEDIVVLAWVAAGEAGDTGSPSSGSDGTGTSQSDTAAASDTSAATARDSGDTGSSSAVSAGIGELIPLLLPRTFRYLGSRPEPWTVATGEFITNDEASVTQSINCGDADLAGSGSLEVMELYACDQPLYDQLVGLYGALTVHEAMCSDDATGLVDRCFDGSGSCGVVTLEYLSAADDDLWGSYEDDCDIADGENNSAYVAQLVSRTLWTKDRILTSRELVVEYECNRLFGLPCAAVTSDVAVLEGWESMVDTTDALRRSPWKELDRYQPSAVTTGTVAYCWGDPTGGLDDIGKEVGGDCSDADILSHRDAAEGPGDLVGQLDVDGAADCSTCLDGIDNNCNGSIDCEDPACAPCFVGQGSGCSSSGTCGGGGCAVASTAGLQGRRAGFVALLWLFTIVTRRRKRA